MNVHREDWKRMESGLLAGIRMGTVSVPALLLTSYAKLDLSETETMLLIHLIGFTEREKKDFPTMDEIRDRMTIPEERVVMLLQKLMKEGYVDIEEETDAYSGIRYERYNLEGLWRKLCSVWVMEERQRFQAAGEASGGGGSEGPQGRTDMYSLFEKEFARPLTPMELETITGWLDDDRYPEELIRMALKEAVFAGKIHFRYIDRILLEWRRNLVYTADQAREHTQRFRGTSRG